MFSLSLLIFFSLIPAFLYKEYQHFQTKLEVQAFAFSLSNDDIFMHRPSNFSFLFWSIGWMSVEKMNPKQFNFGNWTYTVNKSHINEVDAVLLHYNELRGRFPPRRPNQIWIWFNMEPYRRELINSYKLANGQINYTATYSSHSDIQTPYAYIIPLKSNASYSTPYHKNFSEKTKLISWIVSNPSSDRMIYYKQLKRYIEIDTYGKLFRRHIKGHVCEVISSYKFYLAFENTITKDYITEKLYRNAFICGAIPICLGTTRENYVEKGVPNSSFIHVNDFPNASELAKYLKVVASNETLYNSYFEWRNKYEVVETDFDNVYFYIMEQLYKNYYKLKPKIIYNLLEYYPGTENV